MSSTASATSLNFIGFDDNRVVILPKQRETAGKWVHPAAGFVPGQQPYLKRRTQIWNKSIEAANKHLARQGFKQVYNGYF